MNDTRFKADQRKYAFEELRQIIKILIRNEADPSEIRKVVESELPKPEVDDATRMLIEEWEKKFGGGKDE